MSTPTTCSLVVLCEIGFKSFKKIGVKITRCWEIKVNIIKTEGLSSEAQLDCQRQKPRSHTVPWLGPHTGKLYSFLSISNFCSEGGTTNHRSPWDTFKEVGSQRLP